MTRAVGIDLAARALHLVAVDVDPRSARVATAAIMRPDDADALAAACADASAVAVDAPAEPSTAPHLGDANVSRKFRTGRCGEIALGEQHRCWVPWVTPRAGDDTPGWMRVGFRVWLDLRAAGHGPLEVFPAGAFRLLGGVRLPKKSSPAGRRARLDLLDREVTLPDDVGTWGHDLIDACMAALVAAWSVSGGRAVAAAHDHEGTDRSAIWVPRPSDE